MTDILAAIDAAIGCQQCGKPFPEDPKLHVSDDFCSPDCQEAWHAARAETLAPDRGLASEVPEWSSEAWRPNRRSGTTPSGMWVDEAQEWMESVRERSDRYGPAFAAACAAAGLTGILWRDSTPESSAEARSAIGRIEGAVYAAPPGTREPSRLPPDAEWSDIGTVSDFTFLMNPLETEVWSPEHYRLATARPVPQCAEVECTRDATRAVRLVAESGIPIPMETCDDHESALLESLASVPRPDPMCSADGCDQRAPIRVRVPPESRVDDDRPWHIPMCRQHADDARRLHFERAASRHRNRRGH